VGAAFDSAELVAASRDLHHQKKTFSRLESRSHHPLNPELKTFDSITIITLQKHKIVLIAKFIR
jgi:hypothetical protein